jgi:Fe2+ transport system protein B
MLIKIAYAICCIRINPVEMFPKQTISQKKCLMKKEDMRTTTTTTQQNVEEKKNKEKLREREREREREERQQQPKRAKQKQRLPNNTKHNFCTLKSIPTTLFFFFLLPPVFFCTLPLAGAIAQKQVSSLSLTLTPQLRPALLSSLELTGKVF